jgi:hypothetical protein
MESLEQEDNMPDYNNNIVNPNDLLSDSQQEINDNFDVLDTFINVNHVGFDVAASGKHKFVTMPSLIYLNTPLANELDVLCNLSPNTNVPEAYFNSAATATIPSLTAHNQPFNSTWAVFGGEGLILKQINVGGINGFYLVNFPTGAGIPVFNNIYTVQACIKGPSTVGFGMVAVTGFTRTQVALRVHSTRPGLTTSFNVAIMAIGD